MEENVYSLRANNLAELSDFVLQAFKEGFKVERTSPLQPYFYDGVALEFTSDGTLEQLKAVLDAMPEGRTMWGTLRQVPLARNTLECEVVVP